ncbi:hypothetical protein V2J09_021416 [Rumex salicifolius]
MCASPSVFVQSTPEYMKIYDRFKVAKYWQPCSDGDYELSFLKAEAARILAFVGVIILRGMDRNPIVGWRLESMWLHFASNKCLIEIKLKYAKAIESLLTNGRK